MLKFPPDLIVHKGSVFYLLYAAGGLLMTVTAGSGCVDVAVRAAQDPANLLRLSKTLIGLMGLRSQTHAAKSLAKQKLKRLYFTDSSLLDMTRTTLQGAPDFLALCWFSVSTEKPVNLESTSANCISARRCRIYYVVLCGVSGRPVLTLRAAGNDGCKLKAHNPSNQLQWLVDFSSGARARGDVIFLLLVRQTGQISSGSDTNDGTDEPTRLTLGLSALAVVLLWMFLPHIVVCAVIFLGWKLLQSTAPRLLTRYEVHIAFSPCSGSLLSLKLNLPF